MWKFNYHLLFFYLVSFGWWLLTSKFCIEPLNPFVRCSFTWWIVVSWWWLPWWFPRVASGLTDKWWWWWWWWIWPLPWPFVITPFCSDWGLSLWKPLLFWFCDNSLWLSNKRLFSCILESGIFISICSSKDMESTEHESNVSLDGAGLKAGTLVTKIL